LAYSKASVCCTRSRSCISLVFDSGFEHVREVMAHLASMMRLVLYRSFARAQFCMVAGEIISKFLNRNVNHIFLIRGGPLVGL
jgi:hypothetical protein